MNRIKEIFHVTNLKDEELAVLAKETTEIRVKKGEYVFREGSAGSSLYIIKKGTIVIMKLSEHGKEAGISELTKGSIIGEISFFKEGSLRTAAALAKEDSILLEVQNKQIDDLTEKNPKLGAKIYRIIALDMSEKLKSTTDNLISLIQTSRMTALGEMASNIAHEINNPLTTISLSAESLENELKSGNKDNVNNEKYLKKITLILKNIKRVGKIIRGIKTVMRDGSSDEKQKVKLDEIFEETLILCTERMRTNGITLAYENSNRELLILCSSAQISQVFINLLNNACDAIADIKEPWIKIDVKESSSNVEIRIADCGNGIPEAAISKLFTPFFTSKPVGKGTGLGLNISQQIMKSHGGDLVLDRACANTCFVLSLPK